MPGTGVTIRITGPIFDGTKSTQIIRDAAQGTVKELIVMGEARLNQVLRPGPSGVYLSITEARGPGWRTRNPAARDPASKGHYRRSVSRHTKTRGLFGLIEGGSNVAVYGPWLEGVSSRNQTTRFKGYAQFRATRDFINKHVKEVAQKHMARAIGHFNGF